MRMRRAFFAILTLLLGVAPLCATEPKLRSITPLGGQLNSEIEVKFEGERLQDTEEIIAYEPGFKIEKLNLVTNSIVKAQIKIEPDCSLGEHHFRLRTASGLSELMTFFVGSYSVIEEVEPNNNLQKAQPVALNTTIEGVIASEDIDCFVVEAKKGQRLSGEVEGIRVGRSACRGQGTHVEIFDGCSRQRRPHVNGHLSAGER